MNTKTISTYIAAGYTLARRFDTLDITSTGTIGGYGLFLQHLAAVNNLGSIRASTSNGVQADAGVTLTNGSSGSFGEIIGAYSGVFATDAATTINNYGFILGAGEYGDGVFLSAGGTITNHAYSSEMGEIYGNNTGIDAGGAADITNLGRIIGHYADGISLTAGGTVTNGAVHNATAQIIARTVGVNVAGGAAIIVNYGTIVGGEGGGVALDAGGVITNGSGRDTAAYIYGRTTGVTAAGDATVSNFGTIKGAGGASNSGVSLLSGGTIANGSAGDTKALIRGSFNGVYFTNAGVVTNFGTIFANDVAVYGRGDVTVVNGAAADTVATIEGGSGGLFLIAGAVSNFGTIEGGAQMRGGVVTNGSAADKTALIQGGGYGVQISTGPNSSVTNFGTIEGNVAAVQFGDASDTLIVEAGCAFTGQVMGGGGTLDLDTGAGTLTGDLAGGTVTVSGSMAATAFQDFNTVEIGAAASFSTSGKVSIGAGQSVIVAGALTLGAKKIANAGTIETVGGTVTADGKVTGAGGAVIGGGLLDFTGAFNQHVTFIGTAGTLELAKSQSYGGTITGFSKSGGTFLD
ncbi:MAG: beta strand repeat-containing protein, partial [Caulobacteraceae bacterium]